MGNVPTTNLNAYYATTTPGNTINSGVIDPALQDIVQAINDNFALFSNFINPVSGELLIPDQTIVTRHIRNNAITNPKYAALSITADKLADGSITLSKLADLVVTAAKIANGTITEPKYASGSVGSRVLSNGSVQTQHLDPSILIPPEISVIASFDKRGVDVTDPRFGAKGDGITSDTSSIQTAINFVSSAGGGIVYCPKGVYRMSNSQALSVPSNILLKGAGMNLTTFTTDGNTRTANAIEINGSNINFDGIGFDMLVPSIETSVSQTTSMIVMKNTCDSISINMCKFKRGYAGVWFFPNDNQTISNCSITDCEFDGLAHAIYIGYSVLDHNQNNRIYNIKINGNFITNGIDGADGIKTTQKCDNIIIIDNVISYQPRDAIDLFASGDTVIISNNILKNNTLCGVDIKRDTAGYPENIAGYVRKITITNNVIDNNTLGVSVAQITAGGNVDDCYGVDISHNSFTGNTQDVITACGNYITIDTNHIFNNCTDSAGQNFAGIKMFGVSGRRLRGNVIKGNVILNNGTSTTTANGVRIFGFVDDLIFTGNTISNDSALPNANQKIGVYIADDTNNMQWGENIVRGHLRNVWIRNGADVHGKTLYINLGSMTKSLYTNVYIGTQAKTRMSYVDAKFVNAINVPVSDVGDDGSLRLTIKKIASGVVGTTNLAQILTASSALTAYVPVLIAAFGDTDINTDNKAIAINESICFQIVSSGTLGRAFTNGIVEIRYLEY